MHLQWLLPAWAWPVIILIAGVSLFWAWYAYRQTVPALSPRWRAGLGALRAVAILAVVVAIARPLLVVERPRLEPAVIGIVLEDSGSMALADRDDRPSRWREAVMLAAAIDSVAAARGEAVDVVTMRGNGLGPLAVTDLVSARVDTPRSVGSALPQLVQRARQRLLTRPTRALVVLTDGHSDHQDASAGSSEVPTFLVGVGHGEVQADRALVDLRHPDQVQVGEPMIIEFAVRQRGPTAAGTDSVVVELRQGKDVVARQTGPARDFSRFELSWTPDAPGLAVLSLAVSPLDNERFRANNEATLAVDVQKDLARLLLLGPGAGWDGRFLAQAALAEPRVSLAIVRAGPAGPVLADSLVPWRAPLTAAQWRRDWDGVILAGPPGALIPDGGAELAGAVRQGLGLMVLGLDAREASAVAWPMPLRELLPVDLETASARNGEFEVSIAGQERGHPVLAAVTEAAGVDGLPPLQQLVLANLRGEARGLLMSGERPVLAAGRPGDGRVLWFGARRLWELAFWRRVDAAAVTEDAVGRQLLRQMLLWTALGEESAGVALLGRQLAFEAGEAVPVAVRWRDLRGDPITGAPVAVQVRPVDGGVGQRHVLRPDPARPGVSSGVVPPLAPGRWLLEPRGESDPPEVGPVREIVVTPAQREASQTRLDRRTLQAVAGRLGAEVLRLEVAGDRERLLARVAALDLAPQRVRQQSRLEPAATGWWLALAISLLAAEWLLRRRRGLM